ncbi:inner membrane protein YiaA [Planococcus sp. S3-L1]|uniref:inner membrane protein YiaA n=1 Tax=Planococcus sp. S3-L1 TaxID=3046200 RepID=UPI0024BB2D55|nr:inner membrane protein YiaA [Planococcus sp. S3-L1]MDJ0331568.1 inner membrane protein YiaA [Planococcus sp. S3-L1]
MLEDKDEDVFTKKTVEKRRLGEPTGAFKGAAWGALLIGVSTYLIGLYNAAMELNEKGYYITVMILGLYSAVSLQKAVRDRDEGIRVTNLYYGISWFALISAIALMAIGLFNAGSIILSEKGFYGISFILSLFAVVTVQKNVRDTEEANNMDKS